MRPEAVDILSRIDRQGDPVFVDMRRQRQLHDETVDILVRIQFGDPAEQFFLARVRFHPHHGGVETDLVAIPDLVGDIGFAGAVVADEHRRQMRRAAAGREQLAYLFADFPANLFGTGFSV